MAGPPAAAAPRTSSTDEIVEESEALPPIVPPLVKGGEREPVKRSIPLFLVLEVSVYFAVAVLILIAVWVNIWAAYYNGGDALLTRFSADANFLLAAAAVLVIAFELRKERRSEPRS